MMKQIRRHDPEVRAIYMSGDWARLQSATEQEKRKSFVRSLRKPFFQKELMKVLSESLSPGGENVPLEGRLTVRAGKRPGNPHPLS
jgi:hypothetical protein